MKKTNTLGRAEKLKSRKQTEALFAGGKSFFIHPIKVCYQFGSPEQPAAPMQLVPSAKSKLEVAAVQIGVSASKRNFKKAVDRNRVKRLLRETYRLNKFDLVTLTTRKQLNLQVFFIYVDKTLPTFALVEEKIKICLKRLAKLVEEYK